MKSILAIACWAALASGAWAQAPPVNLYRVQVVLLVTPNRFLSPLFQEQLQAELREQLRRSFEGVARVDVVRTHPMQHLIEERGLEQGLEDFELTADLQLQFVRLTYTDGGYQLAARSYDGNTGQLGAVVERAATFDRALVARLAAALVEKNFAPTAVVTEAGKDARLAMRGDKKALERWLKPGAVFAVCRPTPHGRGERLQRLPWALLALNHLAADGTAHGTYYHRYVEDALRPGDRCVKLITQVGPVRVRLLDDEKQPPQPLVGVRVKFSRLGSTKASETTTDSEGLAVSSSKEAFPHAALVQVFAGSEVRQLPVALVDDQPVVCRIKYSPDADALAPIELRRDAWTRRLYDYLELSNQLVGTLNQSLGSSLDDALRAGQQGRKSLRLELQQLDEEHAELKKLAKAAKGKLDLREGEARLAELKVREGKLQDFLERLEKTVKDVADKEALNLQKLLQRGKLYEAETNFDQALALYDQILKRDPKHEAAQHAQALRQQWAVRDEKHAAARKFIYETWPALETTRLLDQLEQAQRALLACKDAGDKLTPRKLLKVNIVHTANLRKQLDALARSPNEDNRQRARQLSQTADGLLRLHAAATEWVSGKKE